MGRILPGYYIKLSNVYSYDLYSYVLCCTQNYIHDGVSPVIYHGIVIAW